MEERERRDMEREDRLDQQIAQAIGEGWRLESRSRYTAMMVKGERPNHVLHLILSLVTLGLWIPVWIILAIVHREQRQSLAV